uniref:Uncharacterized protein n=1 Tax=Panagrolaimus davidi TaxID=227884 RepID=A0A914QKX2_9BILA
MFEKAILKSMKYLNFIKYESHMQVSKEVVLKILKIEDRIASEEKLFEKVCKLLINNLIQGYASKNCKIEIE